MTRCSLFCSLVSEAQRALQVLGAVVTAEVSRRSERELGYGGLAQRKGHRTGTDLVQSVTGQTRADVRRATAAGRDLQAAAKGEPPARGGADSWHLPLVEALRVGALSQEQYDVIRRGLGEPPGDRYPDLERDFLPRAWRQAAAMLIDEAGDRNVEELASAAPGSPATPSTRSACSSGSMSGSSGDHSAAGSTRTGSTMPASFSTTKPPYGCTPF